MKVLVLTSRFPYPLEKGDKLRIYHQLRVLSDHHEVILVSLCKDQPSGEEKEMIDRLVDKQYIFKLSLWKRLLAVLKGFIINRPFRNSYFYSRSIHESIDEIISAEKPDHIYCHLIRMSDYIRLQKITKTIDFMDCFSAGAKKRTRASRGIQSWFYNKEYRLTATYERDIFKDFNHHTIISEQDYKDMPLKDSAKLQIVKNGIDIEHFKVAKANKSYDLGFVGNMGYYPNVEASKYIVQVILPQLPKETKLVLAGARPARSVKQLAGDQVVVSGWVEDIRTIYMSVNIFVAPLFNGIGLQNKILEAMAMGVPVVTTSLVNNAIGAEPEKEILLADTPEQFAKSIKRLENDKNLYAKISNNALSFVKLHYSWEQVTQPLLDLIELH